MKDAFVDQDSLPGTVRNLVAHLQEVQVVQQLHAQLPREIRRPERFPGRFAGRSLGFESPLTV